MSNRNLRKLHGGNALPAPDSTDEEDYEPLYFKSLAKSKDLGLLKVSSTSEEEDEEEEVVVSERESPEPVERQPGPSGKAGKRRRRRGQRGGGGGGGSGSGKREPLEMDEVERSLREVNELLGEPEAAPPDPSPEEADPGRVLLAVRQKHLNVANEMRRLVGEDEERRRWRQLPHERRKALIVPHLDYSKFRRNGLSQSVDRREDGLVYFRFDHDDQYRALNARLLNMNVAPYTVAEAEASYHVEAILIITDQRFEMEDYPTANRLVDLAIAFMQHCSHPGFRLTDDRVRLEWQHQNNRPFLIAVFKLMYLLTTRACHRTALELAKLLLSLDPEDPLAVLFVVDTIALRAREHQWLISAVQYWSEQRSAHLLFNIQYSNALAHFCIAHKNKEELSKADELLQEAMLHFPTVVIKFFECGNVHEPRITAHTLFAQAARSDGQKLSNLINLYAKLSWPKWREPEALRWLTDNALRLVAKHDADPDVRRRVAELANERHNLFRAWPEQVERHLSIIKPMSALVAEGAVPADVGRMLPLEVPQRRPSIRDILLQDRAAFLERLAPFNIPPFLQRAIEQVMENVEEDIVDTDTSDDEHPAPGGDRRAPH